MQKNKNLYKKSIVFLIKHFIFAPSLEKLIDQLAQLVEHLPFKERVLGSSPRLVTTKKVKLYCLTFFIFDDFIIAHVAELVDAPA